MTIDQYFDKIKGNIDKFNAMLFVLETTVQFDARPGDQGFLAGSIYFTDGSILFFKEFIDIDDESVEKLAYSYHYQDRLNQMIFRYDNAFHKPPLSSPDHKHLSDGTVIEINEPELENVLDEIIINGLTDKNWI